MPQITIFSFFSGVGILDLAFENNKYEIVFVNECEEYFLRAYKYTRQRLGMNLPRYGFSIVSASEYTKGQSKQELLDMVEKERTKGNLIGFIGGPPCPDFSNGGKHQGVKGKNGILTKTYFDIICGCSPDFFLFENVKGLVNTEKHRKFYLKMKSKVRENGYKLSDKLVNSLSYYVPQFRERIILIGIKDYILTHSKANIKLGKYSFDFPWNNSTLYDIASILDLDWPDRQPFKEDSVRPFTYNVPRELTVKYWFDKNNVFNHPNQHDQFKVKKGKEKINSFAEGDTKRKSFKRLHRWRFSPTAAYGNNEVHLHPYKPRRLSVAEAMAIQSLPQNFVLPEDIPLTYKFKMIGNGVPYLMAEAISKDLYLFLGEIAPQFFGPKN